MTAGSPERNGLLGEILGQLQLHVVAAVRDEVPTPGFAIVWSHFFQAWYRHTDGNRTIIRLYKFGDPQATQDLRNPCIASVPARLASQAYDRN